MGFQVWDAARRRCVGRDAPLCRMEARIPVKVFVHLYNPDHPTFELTPTIDISCHGARVVTKKIWQPNQQLSVRSIRGNLYSLARVMYCQSTLYG